MSDTKQDRAALLARIRALTSKTVKNGCTEAEATAASAMVDRLLGQYEISLDEISIQEEQELVRMDIAGVAEHPVRYAAPKIAAFTDCKVWMQHGGLAFLGFNVDTEIAEYLTLMFMRAIDREASTFTMFNQDYALQNSYGQRNMLTSFKIGMATRLGERLVELKSKRDFAQRTSGRDLVAVKKPLVDSAFATLGIRLSHSSGGHSIRNTGAYVAGRNAAESVSISQGVAGRASTGRIR